MSNSTTDIRIISEEKEHIRQMKCEQAVRTVQASLLRLNMPNFEDRMCELPKFAMYNYTENFEAFKNCFCNKIEKVKQESRPFKLIIILNQFDPSMFLSQTMLEKYLKINGISMEVNYILYLDGKTPFQDMQKLYKRVEEADLVLCGEYIKEYCDRTGILTPFLAGINTLSKSDVEKMALLVIDDLFAGTQEKKIIRPFFTFEVFWYMFHRCLIYNAETPIQNILDSHCGPKVRIISNIAVMFRTMILDYNHWLAKDILTISSPHPNCLFIMFSKLFNNAITGFAKTFYGDNKNKRHLWIYDQNKFEDTSRQMSEFVAQLFDTTLSCNITNTLLELDQYIMDDVKCEDSQEPSGETTSATSEPKSKRKYTKKSTKTSTSTSKE